MSLHAVEKNYSSAYSSATLLVQKPLITAHVRGAPRDPRGKHSSASSDRHPADEVAVGPSPCPASTAPSPNGTRCRSKHVTLLLPGARGLPLHHRNKK